MNEARSPFLFNGLVGFFLLYYLRPQDFIPILGQLRFVLVYCFILIGLYLLTRRPGEPIFRRDYFAVLILLFVTSAFVSVPFSYWPGGSLKSAGDLLKVVASLLLIQNIIRSFDELERLVRIMVMACAVLGGAILPDWFAGAGHGEIKGIVGGIFANPNDFATNAVLVMPMAYYFIGQSKWRGAKLINFFIFLLILLGVLATQSRGGMLGLGIVLLLMAFQSRRRIKSVFALALIVLTIVMVVPQKGLERLNTVEDYAKQKHNRATLFISGLDMFVHHPLVGVGIDQYSTAYAKGFRYSRDESQRWPDAHGTYTQIISELGILGILAYSLLVYRTFRNMKILQEELGIRGKSVSYRDFVVYLRIGFVGYLFCIIFDSMAYTMVNFLVMCYVSILIKIKDSLVVDANRVDVERQRTRVRFCAANQVGSSREAQV